jgi:hypothetical protein
MHLPSNVVSDQSRNTIGQKGRSHLVVASSFGVTSQPRSQNLVTTWEVQQQRAISMAEMPVIQRHVSWLTSPILNSRDSSTNQESKFWICDDHHHASVVVVLIQKLQSWISVGGLPGIGQRHQQNIRLLHRIGSLQ